LRQPIRGLALTGLLVAAFSGLSGCGGASDTIRVGVAGPGTGPQAKNGQDLKEGVTLAIRDWNAKGGVLGKQVEVVFRDDEALDKNATSVARELVGAGVVGVIGHFNSGCTIPASVIYNDHNVPCITPASTNEYVTERGFKGMFRICGRDDQQAETAATFVTGTLKLKKVAVFDNRTAYGKGLADNFAKRLEGKVEVVLREGFDEKETNLRPYLTKLKESGAELWYFGGIYSQAAPMLSQARGLGITAPLMSGDGVHGDQADFIDKIKEAAEGTLTTFPNTEAAPGYAAFTESYRKAFNTDPGPYAIYSYSATTILLKAIVDAGSADGVAVSKAIHAGAYDTPLGKIAFDERGDVNENTYRVWIVKNGKHVLYDAK
jgi:branched-chain amino acid transport system substrate-binding protein